MKDLKVLDKNLEKALDDFSKQITFDMETFSQTHDNDYLTKVDLEEITRQTFYVMLDFKTQIIDYLKDNTK